MICTLCRERKRYPARQRQPADGSFRNWKSSHSPPSASLDVQTPFSQKHSPLHQYRPRLTPPLSLSKGHREQDSALWPPQLTAKGERKTVPFGRLLRKLLGGKRSSREAQFALGKTLHRILQSQLPFSVPVHSLCRHWQSPLHQELPWSVPLSSMGHCAQEVALRLPQLTPAGVCVPSEVKRRLESSGRQ